MNTSLVIVAAAVAILIIALLLLIARMSATRKPPSRAGKIASRTARAEKSTARWRAVRISPGLICCDAVSELRGQVFLSRLSPSLPLDECTVADCRCRYVHLQDRRNGGDRRVVLGELDAYLPFDREDRRRSRGRRSADLVD